MKNDCLTMRTGQTMVEYVVTIAAILVLVTVLGYFVTAARRSAVRSENLVRSDYP